ncbi:arginyltransferase [Salinimonas chungwhensis]|uniref:arginyltransferase n=1 Tax=Salinimonas chungwhensis TaxID=265425 RepID=UPI00035E3CB9|nr:arginyltransferase [Salinimonas chungwhensis]
MKFGITQTFRCSYLPDEHEQLLVFAETEHNFAGRYGQLIQAGFRRSGSQIYRPHCPSCQACQSVRILVDEFTPSKSQKRIIKKNALLTSQLATSPKDSYYPLYERYITNRHADGTMYPPNRQQFESFVLCEWKSPLFIEAYKGDELVAVAVTDDIDFGLEHQAYSALYTFYAPELTQHSPGTWMIIQQLKHAQANNKRYLYLGYQIDACAKMNYKSKFLPHERFFHNDWHRCDKK